MKRHSGPFLVQLPATLLLALLLSAATHVAANDSQPDPLIVPDQSMPEGEHLVYDISWLGIRVGTGELWVQERTTLDGRDVFHVVGTARPNAFLSKIYRVQDEAHSWIDARTLESLRFNKHIKEGGKQVDETNVFDAASGTGRHMSFQTGMTKEFRVTTPVHDVLSAFYWARRQPLAPGRSISLVLSVDQKNWTLEIDALRLDRKHLRGQGVVDAILLEVRTRREGVLEKRGKAWVYLKNDARRTPVYARLKVPIGSLTGVLRPAAATETSEHSLPLSVEEER